MSVGLHKETVCRVVTLNKFTVLSTDNSYLMKCIHTVHFFLHYAISVKTFRTISFYKPGFFQFNLEIMTCSYTNRVCTGRYLWFFFLIFFIQTFLTNLDFDIIWLFFYWIANVRCLQHLHLLESGWAYFTLKLTSPMNKNIQTQIRSRRLTAMKTARIIPLSTFPRNPQLNKKTRKIKWNIVWT